VEICNAPACDVVHATFTGGSGSGSVRLGDGSDYYIVNWNTGLTGAVAGQSYRIRVLVDGSVLGYRDVQVAATGAQAARARQQGADALVARQTLPIKFRILAEAGTAFDPLDFTDPDVLAQWVLTGDWRVYLEAPPSVDHPAVAFPAPALGTDGNRTQPYPGSESEQSSATSPLLTLGSSLTLLSWHVDEGGIGFYDNKTIRFEPAAGGPAIVLVNCGVHTLHGFCAYLNVARAGSDWDAISIDTSALAGSSGRLVFGYDTGDSCCGFEQGWFVRDIRIIGP
jgi:hypothetical protein